MYPKTHVYFAKKIFHELNDALVLGSIFPDIAVGADIKREISHGSGVKMLLAFMDKSDQVKEFAKGNSTHGNTPKGLDFFGDEQYPPHERGYAFEKARPFIEEVIACNIPEKMAWWKGHNIIEMGVELLISQKNDFGQIIHSAFNNPSLILEICSHASSFYNCSPAKLENCFKVFIKFIDKEQSTAESLAHIFEVQMLKRHQIQIDTKKTAQLIKKASLEVSLDIDLFLKEITPIVQKNLAPFVNI